MREAIEWANQIEGADEIAFSADLVERLRQSPGTITKTLQFGDRSEYVISEDLVIHGPGADLLTVSGDNFSYHFWVQANNPT